MKQRIETYSGKLKDGKPELLHSEEVEMPDLPLTEEQKEIAELKASINLLKARIEKLEKVK